MQRKLFDAVDTDKSGQITAHELREALTNGHGNAFDLDTVKILMAMFDADCNGTIEFEEFSGLWDYIKEWQSIFKDFDKDDSNSIDRAELQTAFKELGYNITPSLIELIEKKYGNLSIRLNHLDTVTNLAPSGENDQSNPTPPPSQQWAIRWKYRKWHYF